MDEIERYVVLLYQCISQLSHANEACKQMFATGNCKIGNIPPTKDALEEHVKHTVYEAGHIWGQSLIDLPQTPSPFSWGWKRQGQDSPPGHHAGPRYQKQLRGARS